MTTATIRDLRYRFPELEARLRRGETIQVFKRKSPVCTLVPAAKSSEAAWPDFAAIRRAIWGKKKFKGSGTQWIREDRDRGF